MSTALPVQRKSILLMICILVAILSPAKITLSQTGDERFQVFSLSYSPDGTQIAVGGGAIVCNYELSVSEKYAIRILDSNTGQLIKSLIGHNCYVNSVNWSPDGTQLVSSSGDGSIRVWNIGTGQQISLYGSASIGHAANSFSDAVWIPSLNQVAYLINEVFFVNPANGLPMGSIDTDIGKTTLALANDGSKFAIGSWENDVEIWNVTGELVNEFQTGPVYSISWSPDGERIVLTGGDEITIYDTDSGQFERTFRSHIGGDSYVVAWSPDGTKIASGGAENTVKIWDTVTGKLLSTLMYSNANGVLALAWSPDSQTLVYGGNGYNPAELVTSCTLDLTSADGCSSQWAA